MGKEKGGRQFLTKIIITRYLYASVIRSVKFRDNEVSLASQRRNTSHFRISPSVTRSKLSPWEARNRFLAFFSLESDWNQMRPHLKNIRVFAPAARFICFERNPGENFRKNDSPFPDIPLARNSANFNARILGSCVKILIPVILF